MGLIGMAAGALRAVAEAAERLERPHGEWCEPSRDWQAESPESRVVPLRIGDDFINRMLQEDGWKVEVANVLLRPYGDGTWQMFFREADEVDHSANRAVQRMVLTALDLAATLEVSNCDLPDEAIEALAEFRKASRARLGSGMM